MCLWHPGWPVSIPWTCNVCQHILGYRHRSNGRSQTHGLFMTNDQHWIPHLLSLLTTFYVKVDFFKDWPFGQLWPLQKVRRNRTIWLKFFLHVLWTPESLYTNFEENPTGGHILYKVCDILINYYYRSFLCPFVTHLIEEWFCICVFVV